jgi:hypothetical protein
VSTSTARVSPFDTSRSVASFRWLWSVAGALSGERIDREMPPGDVLGALSAVRPARVSLIRISRTIFGPSALAETVATEAGGVDGVNVARRKATFPNATRSSTSSVAAATLRPFTNVPLLDPRSRSVTWSSSTTSSAWRREMVGSDTDRSQVGARPTMRGAFIFRSNDWVPSGLMRR